MPKINIEKTLSVKPENLFKMLEKALTEDKEVKALEPGICLEADKQESSECSGQIKGNRIKGLYSIKENASKESDLSIEINLPLVLSPFKSLVKSKIEAKLEQLA